MTFFSVSSVFRNHHIPRAQEMSLILRLFSDPVKEPGSINNRGMDKVGPIELCFNKGKHEVVSLLGKWMHLELIALSD